MKEQIDTSKGLLTAELWHVGAYVVLNFDGNYHASIHGKTELDRLGQALQDFRRGQQRLVCDDLILEVEADNNGRCIFRYKGTSQHSFSTSVLLTEPGHTRLLEILAAGIAQALTPEQIAEGEERKRKHKIRKSI